MSADDPEAKAFAADRLVTSLPAGETVDLPPADEPITFAESSVDDLVRWAYRQAARDVAESRSGRVRTS